MLKSLGVRNVRRKDQEKILEISRPYLAAYGDDFFPTDEMHLRRTFTQLLSNMPYFRLVTLDGIPVAWLAARESSPHPYSPVRCLTQTFFHSCVEGLLSVRVLQVAHDDLLEYAASERFAVVYSSSFLDNKDVFYRVLQKAGWTITPLGALKKV